MAAHTTLGYLLAVGLAGADGEHLRSRASRSAALGRVFNGGTLALNSAFDRDEGDIAYLRNPPPPPERLALFSLGLMVVGQLAALALPPLFGALYGLCFALSVLYSVPPFRLKAVAGVDWLINMIGFGTLTPLAGWATTGRPVGTVPGNRPARLLPALRRALSAHPALSAGGGRTTRRPDTRPDARDPRKPRRGARRGRGGVPPLRLGGRALGMDARCGGLALESAADRPARLGRRAGAVAVGGGASPGPGTIQRRMYFALGAWAVTDVAVLLVWGT